MSAVGTEVLVVASTLPLILVVDDNPENLTVIGELLQPGHAVRAANGGERALRLARQRPLPDLVLLDVMMPDMDGYEVLARLRADPLTADLPVIFLTALNSLADEEHGLALGAVDYITKPIRPAILLARVRTQLRLKAVRDDEQRRVQGLDAELARRLDDAQRSQDISIHALAQLAEAHDPGAARHLRRTQAFVQLLGRWLQQHGAVQPRPLDDAELQLLVRAVPLHDIGKAAIPASILGKPGPLSASEWTQVMTHTYAGADALAQAERDAGQSIELLRWAHVIARSHHERWDGGGYPDGLAGDAIPLAARLMALADALDAMTSRRAHQPPLSFAQARDAILRERGTQFDPQLVDAFSASFDALCAIADGMSPDAEDPPADAPAAAPAWATAAQASAAARRSLAREPSRATGPAPESAA